MTDAKTMPQSEAFEKYLDQLADHFARMAQVDGFKDYARQRLRELVKDESGMFTKLPALVKEKLENFNKEKENGNN